MLKRVWIPLILLLFILSACSPAMSVAQDAAPNAPSTSGGAPAYESENMRSATTTGNLADVSVQGQPDRLVIKNANLNIAVTDPTTSLTTVANMATEMGGYVVSSNLYKTTTSNGAELPEATITIRVPAERLDDAMNQIKALVPDPTTDILAENVTGQDVTKDYTDLKSRLVNLENTEKQLQKIMDQATKTEDVLAVYNQLVSVREQIEVLKGQIQYYEESAALSMIAVTLKSKAGIEPLSIGGWQPVGVARNALQTTVEAFKFLVNAAIWLVLFALPIGLLIFLPLRLLWWLIRRRRKNKPPVAPAAPPTNPENPA